MNIYREEILDHFKNPRNFGSPKKSDGWKVVKQVNSACGDMVKLGVKIGKGKVEGVLFEGEGCAVSMAATSMLTEMIKGKSLKYLEGLKEKDVFDRLGIPVSSARQKCAKLGLMAWKQLEALL